MATRIREGGKKSRGGKAKGGGQFSLAVQT